MGVSHIFFAMMFYGDALQSHLLSQYAKLEAGTAVRAEWGNNMRLPDMVKQIGKVSGKERVYVEDYVYTYLNELKKEVMVGSIFPVRAALFGHVYHKERQIFYLIYGAACVVDELENGSNEEQVRKEYFEEYELIGYVNIYGSKQELPGRKEGYYIFYEKNEAMQNYLLACYERKNRKQGKEGSGEKGRNKKLPGAAGGKMPFSLSETIKRLLYGECIVILALAVTAINDYNKMHGFVETAGNIIMLTETEK